MEGKNLPDNIIVLNNVKNKQKTEKIECSFQEITAIGASFSFLAIQARNLGMLQVAHYCDCAYKELGLWIKQIWIEEKQ